MELRAVRDSALFGTSRPFEVRAVTVFAISKGRYLMRDMKLSVPWLLPATFDSVARKRHRIRFTQRSNPAGAEQPPLAGTYVHVVPPSLEYSVAALKPAGSAFDALATLNCTYVGIESTSARLEALAVPTFVTVELKVRSVPGVELPGGFTVFATVIDGRMTVTMRLAVTLEKVSVTERARSRSVSIVPAATFPIRYDTVTADEPPKPSGERRALSGTAP